MNTPPADPPHRQGSDRVRLEATALEQGRVYQAGRDQHIKETVLPPEALRPVAEVSAPQGLVNLPVRPSIFVGRESELARLRAALAQTGRAVVQAVHGLGGIGKSTLAAHYAATHAGDLNPVWWVNGDTPAAIEAGLAELATALQPELTQALPLEALEERALQWLACHDGWLLVLDNITDPTHVARLAGRLSTGRLLVTSRRATGWQNIATPLRLDVLAEAEAVDLLTKIATHGRQHDPADMDGAAELCAELGHLPLAIEQAGAYIAETGCSVREYLNMLAGYPAVMYDQAAEGADAERTIARIWRITLGQLSDTPLAGQLLRLLAWYAPESIPRGLLDPPAASPQVNTAIGRLVAYNLITRERDSLAVHRLVQAVARTPDPEDPHRQQVDIRSALHQATRLLVEAIPQTYNKPEQWPAWRAFLPHIAALTKHASPDTDTVASSHLLTSTGLFVNILGDYTRAISYHQRALTVYTEQLGTDHPITLNTRINLAEAFQNSGEPGRAIPLLEATLADTERTRGIDDPHTVRSRNNLATAYHAAGDLGRAIRLYEGVLADSERVLGIDNPETLTTRNNLAFAHHAAGNLSYAIPLLETTLADIEKTLGKDHLSTLVTRGNLAYVCQKAGNLGRAISLYKANLADCIRVLGHDHPTTLTTRNNLAFAYESTGDLDRAIPLFEKTLIDCEHALGTAHPTTLGCRNDLANAYESAGDLDRAIPLYKATLTDRERVHGTDHPDTLTTRSNLAYAYHTAGNLDRAIRMHKATLTDRERILGTDHPDTLTTRNNLAAAYHTAGNLGRAIRMHKATLTDRERVLGTDHPDTLESRNNLADAYQSAGAFDRAIPLLEKGLTDCERIFGTDHPIAPITRNNLASIYQKAGAFDRAIPLFEETLAECERVHGTDHPQTLTVRNNLAHAYKSAGNLSRAIPLYEATLTDCRRLLGDDHPITQTVRNNLKAIRRRS